MRQNKAQYKCPPIWSNDFRQGCQDHSMGEMFFQQMCWGNWIATCKRMKSGPNKTPYIHKSQLRIHTRAKTTKLLNENTGQKLHDIEFSNNFLDIIPKVQTTKDKVDLQS